MEPDDSLNNDELSLNDLNPLADGNLFEASEEANRGENHPPDDFLLSDDNSINFQDPDLRLA